MRHSTSRVLTAVRPSLYRTWEVLCLLHGTRLQGGQLFLLYLRLFLAAFLRTLPIVSLELLLTGGATLGRLQLP